MTTKMPVRRNFNPTAEEMAIRRAIHVLQDACDDEIVLMQDDSVGVYLIPTILPEVEPTEVDGSLIARPAGTVEYQVSDGLPGHRGTSIDCYTLAEAINEFKRIQSKGWKHA